MDRRYGQIGLSELTEDLNHDISHDVALYNTEKSNKRQSIIADAKHGFTTGMKIQGKSVQNLFNPNGINAIYEESESRLNIIDNNNNMYKANKYTVINFSDKVITIAKYNILLSAYVQEIDIQPNDYLIIELSESDKIYNSLGKLPNGWQNTDADKAELKQSLLILEGDWTDKELPNTYFSGIQSVSNTNLVIRKKNLFNINRAFEPNKIDDPNYYTGSYKVEGNDLILTSNNDENFVEYIVGYSKLDGIKKGKTYTLSFETDGEISNIGENMIGDIGVYLYNGDIFNYIAVTNKQYTFTAENDTYYLRFDVDKKGATVKLSNIQVEEGTKKTEYEPYMITEQNIVETLRSIGDVHDELDIDKGIITRRIGEIILDGSDDEKWTLSKSSATNNTWLEAHSSYKNGGLNAKFKDVASLLCDKLKYDLIQINAASNPLGSIFITSYVTNSIRVLPPLGTQTPTLEDSIAWLKANPITVLYELAEPVIEKINYNNMEVFDDNNIVEIEGNILPDVEFKYPVNTKSSMDTIINNVAKVNNIPIPSNPNLLINGDFTNPVNQREQRTYTNEQSYSYTIDRWVLDTGGKASVTVNKDSITISRLDTITDSVWVNFATNLDVIEFKSLIGKTLTLAFKLKNKTDKVSQIWCKLRGTGFKEYLFNYGLPTDKNTPPGGLFSDGKKDLIQFSFVLDEKILNYQFIEFGIQIAQIGASIELEYAKLEVGNKATPFVPRSYGEELALCQRYYLHNVLGWIDQISNSTNSSYFVLFTPTSLRINPTFTQCKLYDNSKELTYTGVSCYKNRGSSITVCVRGCTIPDTSTPKYIEVTGVDAEIY